MRHLDLFSGISGFALAAQWVWGDEHEIISFCDNDKVAQCALKKHWPGVPIHDDIKTLDATKWQGTVDLVTGGFPCQPFSCAGKRRGKADDRYLWPEMLRVIDECQPRWVLGENVAGIVNMELESVCASLEGEGYEVQPLVIPACAVDAPHIRARVWIVAHAPIERPGEARGFHAGCSKRIAWGRQDVAHASRKGLEGAITEGAIRAERLPAECGAVPNSERQQDGRIFKRRIQSHSCDDCNGGSEAAAWPTEPDVGRVAHGIPYRVHRLRLLGNSIVPQVAAEIFRAMKVVMAELAKGA
jgi:DNA (cytosine-5)-methyltransferase 1